MDIMISLDKTELKVAWGAISALGDNEDDQGIGDGTLANALSAAINRFAELYGTKQHDGPERATIDVIHFAIMLEAVEIFCTDPVEDDPADEAAARAFAVRLRDLPTIVL